MQHSECCISLLVLFQFDPYHQYLYPLRITCFYPVLFLSFPTRLEKNQEKIPIALSGFVIYYS